MSILRAAGQRQMYDEWKEKAMEDNSRKEASKGNGAGEGDAEMSDETLDWENFVVVEQIEVFDENE